MTRTRKNAFTLIELLVVISIIALLIGILLPALGTARKKAAQLQDSSNIRSIMQALVLFAGNNKENYPLPSTIDKNDKTLNDYGTIAQHKNTTGNIFGILISAGVVETGILFSPVELGNFEEYNRYEHDAPSGAVTSSGANNFNEAIWDPNFKATPRDTGASAGAMGSSSINGYDQIPGGFSYAHTPPFSFRRSQWANTFDALEPALANRGPVYQGGGEDNNWDLLEDGGFSDGADPLGENSVTIRTQGNTTEWAGNVGFNDAHVTFYNQPDPPAIVWSFSELEGTQHNQPDNIFANEDDQDRTIVTPRSGATMDLGGVNNNRNAFLTQYYEVDANSGTTVISPYYD